MTLSILTATYNRSELLNKLYISIVNNLFNSLHVEWLIMDDGSTDNTEEVVKGFKKSEAFTIVYFKQKNQGKMQAINNLMKYVTGELVMDCDSDDYFIKDSFKYIYEMSDVLLKDSNLYGLVFLKNESSNKLSGNKFLKENIKTTMFEMYFKDGIVGEKIIIFKTSIRKLYTHELIEGEKFITESRMYHKMDKDYSVKCFNKILIEGKYLEDGYTNNINKVFIENPKGYFEFFKEVINKEMKGVKFSKRIYIIKHYILFKYLCEYKGNDIKNLLNRLLYYIVFVPAKIVLLYRFKGKNMI